MPKTFNDTIGVSDTLGILQTFQINLHFNIRQVFYSMNLPDIDTSLGTMTAII